ncbi:MAG: hypothetical protein KDE35_03840 [Geminicoccaceae bacterium]|nr:hypothetical protein [Geminicoccaceae bacterium]
MSEADYLLRLRKGAAIAAGCGLLVCALFALFDLEAVWRAHLVAFFALHTVPLGCLGVLLIWHLTGGRWGRLLAEPLEAAARTLPLVVLLGLPVLFDIDGLFAWARPDYLAAHEIVAAKTAWLDTTFFAWRTLFYLLLWAGLALLVTRPRRSLVHERRHQGWAGIAAVLLVASTGFAAVDWSMSLDPTFNSATYGLILVVGHLNSGLCFAILVLCATAEARARTSLLERASRVGLGGLLQGAILLWAYAVAMEFVTIWSGDLPHNAAWFLARGEGGWAWVIWIVALAHFVVPFLVLLSSRMRRELRVVAAMAGLVLLGQLLHMVWQTAPSWGAEVPSPVLMIATFLVSGGIWTAAFTVTAATRTHLLPAPATADE